MLRRLRVGLPYLLAVWFACQIGAEASTLILLTSSSSAEECSCVGHGDHRMCPMHRGAASRASCRLTAPQNGSNAVAFWALFGPIGVMPEQAISTAPLLDRLAIETDPSTPIQRPDIPEPPPPRAFLPHAHA